MAFQHIPVLFHETIDSLRIRPDGVYIDGTAGGGGHSQAILDRLQTGLLLSIDQDPDAIAVVTKRFEGNPCSLVRQANFADMARVAAEAGISRADGVLLDIGVSSYQLDTPERGFSYHSDAPLDMRMSQSGPTAADLVAGMTREELARVLREYGEEPYAWQIAGKVVAYRQEQPLVSTAQLAQVVSGAVPPAVRRKDKNPARRTFQALRIAVNGELDALSDGMDAIFSLLKPGGRFCIITFHSLEDRLVKQRFREWATACTCPPEFPVCVCGGKAKAKLITKKPIEAGKKENEENRRARSAKLRIVEKI